METLADSPVQAPAKDRSNPSPRRHIRKVAVLGSGVMGSQIALLLSGIGLDVLLLDIVPFELTPEEQKKGLSLQDKIVRNRLVNSAFEAAKKLNPSPLYSKEVLRRIRLGNFDDDLPAIAQCDWVIEVVTERLDIKRSLFEKVEKYRRPGTLITSNTSGIPMAALVEGRSEDFARHFCGTHFFNPPRYLRLLEIIPGPKTDPEIVEFWMDYGSRFLGKTTVLCKDTPAFIANRIGVFGIMALFHNIREMGLTVEEVDKLTGPVLGRPKSATFRTADVVGLDTLANVANGLKSNLPHDEAARFFELPDYLQKMLENKWLGQKTKQGFYKKMPNGEIYSLDLNTLEYVPQKKVRFATLEEAKKVDNLRDRLKVLFSGKDNAGAFYRKTGYALFEYVSRRIPEISDEIYKVDDAMCAGFGWHMGPFAMWDALGLPATLDAMRAEGYQVPAWVQDMVESGFTSFYKVFNGHTFYYDQNRKDYVKIPGRESFIILDNLRENRKVWGNSGTTLLDLGDGVLNLEFHTKMNAIGGEVIAGIRKAIDIAESEGWNGLVIANNGENFSAGANLAMILMMAVEQEWDELNYAIKAFQDTMMRVRYSAIPVVAAPQGLTLGGGCELCLHADAVVAAAETYIGLVEVGVGLIPAGGGTKEFALRASDEMKEEEIRIPTLKKRFLTIGQAKVATSGFEAYELGIFRTGRDKVVMHLDRRISVAKQTVLQMASEGYTQPVQRRDIMVLGREGLGVVWAGANAMYSGRYISEHDMLISQKLGYVLCGGDLSERTPVSEQYLLDLEREAFLSLLGTRKTLERIKHTLQTGKPLRN
ncbi:MAG: 3-hydroxyacyl-CoA dehydrogenase NAD-binding domain-containing protein [Flavobacteriales bacterium]|nr:3-hydroxyacyl-CoA dehydrogenase NAD-binding domain-containing protein [Flavobacteriales bacterium]MDW8431732.1 3-hydroxyacyl-CoA dehydrogenase NAD-binding domain-containing protein [Flavobacteriales bacterium]